ncbi:MAG: MFS transporter [Myxococcota bacterium]
MASPIRDGLALLRQRDFARLFSAYLITHTGSAMAPIALAFGVLELTGSTRDAAWVVAAPVAAQIVILMVGGAMADRTSRQRILVRADALSALSQGVVATLFLTGQAELPLLVGFMLINGGAFAFHQPASVGFIPQVVAPADIHAANALLGAARSAALMVGAALAGLLVAAVGPGATLALDALSFALASLLIAGIRARSQARPEQASLWTDLRIGWSEFTSHDWLWTIVLQFSVLIMGVEALFGLVGPATARDLLGGAPDWGFIMACFGAGTVAGGALSLRLRIERPMLVATLTIFLWAPLPVLMTLPAPLPWLAGAAFVMGVAGQLFGVLWYTTLHTRIPPERLSRVSAYDHLGSIVLAPLGVVLAGRLYESIGGPATLWLIVGAIVVPTALVLLVRDVREMRSGPAERAIGDIADEAARPDGGALPEAS